MKKQASLSTYEFPLTNRVRTFLRYEYLINLLNETIEKQNDELKAIILLHQLLELMKCNDIKSELIQHMKWQKQQLQSYEESYRVDQQQLEKILEQHQRRIDDIDGFDMPLHFYQNHHFLNLMKLRLGIPAGTCGFDIPQLQAWLDLPLSNKHEILRQWKQPFDTIGLALNACMQIMRQSKNPESKTAKEGFYAHNMSAQKNISLLRIAINNQHSIYPEVSSGKNRFTMYFFSIDCLEKKPLQVQRDVPFTMVLCSL